MAKRIFKFEIKGSATVYADDAADAIEQAKAGNFVSYESGSVRPYKPIPTAMPERSPTLSLDPFLLDFFAYAKIMAMPDEFPDIRDGALRVLHEVAQGLAIDPKTLPWSKWKFLERTAALIAAHHECMEIDPTPWQGIPLISSLVARCAVDRQKVTAS